MVITLIVISFFIWTALVVAYFVDPIWAAISNRFRKDKAIDATPEELEAARAPIFSRDAAEHPPEFTGKFTGKATGESTVDQPS